MSRLLGRENDGMGVETRYHREDGKFVVEQVQDVEGYLGRNKREANCAANETGDMRKVASIPLVVIHKWLKMGINIFDKNDMPKISRLLNSPEYRYLKTTNKRIVFT